MHWLLLLVLGLAGCNGPPADPPRVQLTSALGGTDVEGFARASQVIPFAFPRDHGPHPDFRNEWWYLTGNLETEDGRAFGFQVTFFRIALQPHTAGTEPDSAWRTDQVWMAHAALSDLSGRRHHGLERFSRQSLGLAGGVAEPFSVWLENWRLRQITAGQAGMQLQLPADSFELQLRLDPLTPILLQGDRGLSQKSAQPGNASYYYSIPRLRVSGHLAYTGQSHRVTGLAWLDREWSTSALGPNQIGWDWFALHLDDGNNLMYYQLRRKDGDTDRHSSGTLSDDKGLLRRLGAEDIQLTPIAFWRSGERRYPIEWRLQLRGEPQPWRVRALLPDQEMQLSVRYWEGAVEVLNDTTGRPLGRGYLEMTGY